MPVTLERAKSLARFLYHQRIKGFTVSPRIFFGGRPAEEAFVERMVRSRSYLEFGSGSSTLCAARAGVPAVAVEGDRFFARVVKKALPDGADVRFVVPDIGFTVELSRPFFTTPTERRLKR